MKILKKITTAAVMILVPSLGFAQEETQLQLEAEAANPAAPAETSQLDFLIGDWVLHTKVVWAADDIREKEAELSVRYILEGFAIQMVERHPPAPPPGNPDQAYWATTILNYDADNNKWTGASVNTLGNRKFVEGEFKDGVFTLVQTGKLFNSRTGSNRLVFENITPDSYEYRLEYTMQDWQDWQRGGYSYTAVRK